MAQYAIYSEGGQELTQVDVPEVEARWIAQRMADQLREAVYLDTVPSSTDPDDDADCGEEILPKILPPVRLIDCRPRTAMIASAAPAIP